MPAPDPTSECYVRHGGHVEPWTQSPCGDPQDGVQACCERGDFCMENSICLFTHPNDIKNTSGYYTGGCTDRNFNDPVCSRQCTDHGTQDIVYNTTRGLWSCCYESGSLDCGVSSDETFLAPAPADLKRVTISATSTQKSSTAASASSPPTQSSITTTPSASSLAASTPSSTATNTASGLSTGAKAGVGVGAAIAGLIFIAAVFVAAAWFRRRKRQMVITDDATEKVQMGTPKILAPQELSAQQRIELDSGTRSEMDGQASRKFYIQELGN
ncbi:MAG: hypothetical protein Q9219_004777 [cf. Caloplaca sp. 3 TL-2023]